MDVVLSATQIEDFFADLTLQILGLDPAAKSSQDRVRIGWPSNGAPAWKRTEDVAFLLINYDDDPITRQVDIAYSESTADIAQRSSSYTRVLRINWVFYGPNSFDDADRIRHGLFLSVSTDALAANNMALVLDMNAPMRSPELFNGQWWERTSFYARFNELVVRRTEVPYLKSADVQIVKG